MLNYGDLEVVPATTVNYPNKLGSRSLLFHCVLKPSFSQSSLPHKSLLPHLPTPILGSSFDSSQNSRGKKINFSSTLYFEKFQTYRKLERIIKLILVCFSLKFTNYNNFAIFPTHTVSLLSLSLRTD